MQKCINVLTKARIIQGYTYEKVASCIVYCGLYTTEQVKSRIKNR